MSKKFTSTTEEVQVAMKKLQQLQFQREEMDKQYAAQFNALYILISSLPDSETQKMICDSLNADDCSGKRKRENEEEQNYNGNRPYKSNV
jgi:hypothetical protein